MRLIASYGQDSFDSVFVCVCVFWLMSLFLGMVEVRKPVSSRPQASLLCFESLLIYGTGDSKTLN